MTRPETRLPAMVTTADQAAEQRPGHPGADQQRGERGGGRHQRQRPGDPHAEQRHHRLGHQAVAELLHAAVPAQVHRGGAVGGEEVRPGRPGRRGPNPSAAGPGRAPPSTAAKPAATATTRLRRMPTSVPRPPYWQHVRRASPPRALDRPGGLACCSPSPRSSAAPCPARRLRPTPVSIWQGRQRAAAHRRLAGRHRPDGRRLVGAARPGAVRRAGPWSPSGSGCCRCWSRRRWPAGTSTRTPARAPATPPGSTRTSRASPRCPARGWTRSRYDLAGHPGAVRAAVRGARPARWCGPPAR